MFGVLIYLTRGAFDGGSVIGVFTVLFAVLLATAAGTLARRVPAPGGDGPATADRRPRARTALAFAGAATALLAAIVLWVMAFAAFTGCAFHCDVSERSPVAGVVLTILTMAALGGSGALVARGMGARPRAIAIAGAVGAAVALAAVTSTVVGFHVR